MNLRVGRYISLPDIEAQLAPNNYTYSHSILYTVDCYTQLGANATVKMNDHWTVQGRHLARLRCDAMDNRRQGDRKRLRPIHLEKRRRRPLHLRQHHQRRKYAYNNLTAFYETWYHRFNAHWHTDTRPGTST